jgi:DNA-binding MarR family transcriptional regulator
LWQQLRFEPAVSVNVYAETITLIERLHRRFLDVLRVELERLGVEEINNVQALLLANLGDAEVSVGELMTRGYYLGSNVSYNLKRLVATGHVVQERSQHDRRVVRVRLSEAGRTLRAEIGSILARHCETLAERGRIHNLERLNARLHELEGFWAEQVSSRAPRRAISAFGDLAQQDRPLGAGD